MRSLLALSIPALTTHQPSAHYFCVRSNRTASVLGALDAKLADIEATEKQKREYLVAYDLNRQLTVNELIVAQQQAIAAQAQAKLAGVVGAPPPGIGATGIPGYAVPGNTTAAGGSSRRGVLGNMGGVGSSSGSLQIQSGGSSQFHGHMQRTPSPTGDEMDLDPPPREAASRRKPPTSSSTSGGPAVRKRARNGQ